MKEFIKNEIMRAKAVQKENDTLMTSANRTIEELQTLRNALLERSKEFEKNFLKKIVNIDFDDNLYSTLNEIVEAYTKIPLLEIELSLRYPILATKQISSNSIIHFTNKILLQEGLDLQQDEKSLLIFEKKRIDFKKLDSRCITYNRFYTNEKFILLNKFYNLYDIILPVKQSILMSEYDTFNNKTNILCYFMEHRTIKALIANGSMDAKNAHLIFINNLIYDARKIKLEIKNRNWRFLSSDTIFRLLDFIDRIIGMELAYTDITYEELNNILSSSCLNINDLPINEEIILENSDKHAKSLLKKEYYQR